MIAGRGPSPVFVLALVQRLPDTSLTAALAAGGRHLLGWGQDRHLIADLYDAVNVNTRATGQWGKGKAPKIPPWPRPTSKAPGKSTGSKPPVTVAAIYQQFAGR
ncbi:hypothetical protein ACFVTF_26545 [Kitasatospora sp. NPDC057940]|uniref:hypothetical protein n=1 Tax=Kitasatospora sp. NPDC057940 TaxID=3346285 RepID=UPI0036DAE7BA